MKNEGEFQKEMPVKEIAEDELDIKALFLGPKSENRDYFLKTLNFLIDEHLYWRRDFHPEDKDVTDSKCMRATGFMSTLDRTTEVLMELSSKLKKTSEPWFSARYLGHMNNDTLMVANLAYMATILYNPNNVAYESSVATSQMEIEVGHDFAALLGFDPDKAWGHVTTDGTIANYEGLWLARNLKSFPIAVKNVKPELVKGKSDWELLNLPTSQILDLIESARKANVFDAARQRSARGTGVGEGKLGVVLVPQSKHYSWVKAVDVLGIGQENLVAVQVDDEYHMDIDALQDTIDKHVKKKVPIMAVIGVVGTTEEGAVDKFAEIVDVRDECEKEGVSFYLHCDAAYGGYSRALYLDENMRFMNYEEMRERVKKEGFFKQDTGYPTKLLHASYRAMGEADSITIDPHKMGYVPYAAGGIALKDQRILDLISYTAEYVFEQGGDAPSMLGSYIMEGSKSGAAAASVWASHRAIPLNIKGYGQIIGRSIQAARILTHLIRETPNFSIEGREFLLQPLCLPEPDFNIVCMAFNEKGNTDLKRMNELNMRLYEQSSYLKGPVFLNEWITSHTTLNQSDYGDAPMAFVKRLGIPEKEWAKTKTVTVLRMCTLNPFLAHYGDTNTVWKEYLDIWKVKLQTCMRAR